MRRIKQKKASDDIFKKINKNTSFSERAFFTFATDCTEDEYIETNDIKAIKEVTKITEEMKLKNGFHPSIERVANVFLRIVRARLKQGE